MSRDERNVVHGWALSYTIPIVALNLSLTDKPIYENAPTCCVLKQKRKEKEKECWKKEMEIEIEGQKRKKEKKRKGQTNL